MAASWFNRASARSKRKPLEYVIGLEPLEGRALLSAPLGFSIDAAIVFSESEPNQNARKADTFTLAEGQDAQLGGTSTRSGDKDFFKFTAEISESIHFIVNASGSALAKLEITDANGNKIAQTEPKDGVNAGQIDVVAGETYYFRLRSTESRAAVDYTVNIGHGALTPGEGGATPPDTVNESLRNDKKKLAQVVALGDDGFVRIEGLSDNKRDKDYFQFTADTSGTLTIDLINLGGADAELEVEQLSNSRKLLELEDGPASATLDVEAGTTYTIRVRSAAPQEASAYAVELSVAPGDGGGPGEEPANTLAETEPNNQKFQADVFSLGSDGQIQLTGTAANKSDDDFFRFTAQTSGTIDVTLTGPGGADTVAELEIETQESVDVLELEPAEGPNSGSFDAIAGTTYYIRLRAPDDVALPYEVNLTLTA